VNISFDDQKMISEFSKRHTKIKELESELRAYREIKEKMKDCGEELEIAFDTDEDKVE
jgi:hypothetical protein